ncbi:MAG: UxaA family hydrolase [Nitrososphaeria archaeon]
MTFLGYERPDGSIGVRNYVLMIPGGVISDKVCHSVIGCKTIVTADAGSGRSRKDRETIARTLIGLGRNPNVASVIVHGRSVGAGYPELEVNRLADEISKSGKHVEVLDDTDASTLSLICKGIDLAREMVYEASKLRRREYDDISLCLGVKCGASDTTSGIVGNPIVGYVFDKLVTKGGTALFGENTEIIGAEHILAKRASSDEVAKEILKVAKETEERAKATGEDIRTINPVPANIAGGITTLEEKSLGAIAKSGSTPIKGVLKYAERPKGRGLYFVDNWMGMLSIFLGYAASGAQIVLFQLGGGGLSGDTILYSSGGIVAPLLWLTANPKTYRRFGWKLDFYSGTVIEGKETIQQAGERLYDLILDVASGTMTKTETLTYVDPNQIYTTDPIL